jgi:EmrB/QacA subfamily drug resistance transporter
MAIARRESSGALIFRMLVPLIIGSALLMQFVDSTAVLTALPAMARSLNSDPANLSIIISAYMLSLSVFIPASGWIADRWGARTIFQIAIAIFTLASILCGLSESVPQLTAARVLQGAGAALMTPVARLILLRKFQKSELVRATTWFSTPALIGPMFAPLLGGFLTDYASWRWIFFINAPVGLLAIVLVGLFVENYRGLEAKPFDWTGFGLTAAALVAIMSAADAIAHGALSLSMAAPVIAGVAAIVALTVRHARRSPAPILDLSLFRFPTFRISNTGGMLYRIAFNAILILQPVLLQFGFGMDAIHSGGLTLFGAVGLFTMRPWIRPLLRRFGFRAALGWNALVGALAIILIVPFTAHTPPALFAVAFFLGGITRCLQYTSLSTIVFADVPATKASAATSFSTMSDRFSGALGASVAGLFLHLATGLQGRSVDQLQASDIQWAIAALAVLVALSGISALTLRRDAGSEVSGHTMRG